MAFLAPTLALWTSSFLSPSCIPFSPAMAYVWRTRGGGAQGRGVGQGPGAHHLPTIPQIQALVGEEGRQRAESLESPRLAGLLPPIPRRGDLSENTAGWGQGWIQSSWSPGLT